MITWEFKSKQKPNATPPSKHSSNTFPLLSKNSVLPCLKHLAHTKNTVCLSCDYAGLRFDRKLLEGSKLLKYMLINLKILCSMKESTSVSRTIPCFAATVFFYKLKGCGNPASSKSLGAIFLTGSDDD